MSVSSSSLTHLSVHDARITASSDMMKRKKARLGRDVCALTENLSLWGEEVSSFISVETQT